MKKAAGFQIFRQGRCPSFRLWAASAAVVSLVVSGCDSKPETIATPEPRVTYGEATPDMCTKIKMTELAARFGLKLRPDYDPTVQFDTRGTDVYLSCEIRAYDDSKRFRTGLGEFAPAGTVSLRTYPTHEQADKAHQVAVASLRKFVESKPEVSTQNVSGWWDEGLYVETVAPIDPKQYPRIKNLDAAGVEVLYEVRHGNLRVTTRIDDRAPTPETAEVLAFLRDLADAFTRDAVSLLSRTGPN